MSHQYFNDKARKAINDLHENLEVEQAPLHDAQGGEKVRHFERDKMGSCLAD